MAGLLLYAGVLLFPHGAQAQARVEFIPSMSLFSVYDDNIFARVEGSAGQMLQLRSSFEGSYESPTVRLLGLYSFDMPQSNLSSLNTLDARRHALGETRLRVTPFTTLGLAVRYDRSETPGEIDIDSGVLGVLLYRAEQELPLRDLVDSTRCASANWVGGSRIHRT